METETIEKTPLDTVIEMIDKTLNDIAKRELVSSVEMADTLLDMRLLLTK